MRMDRRGCFYLVMFGIVLVAMVALMEAFRMLVTFQQERQEERRDRDGQPRWLNLPERKP